MFLEDIALLGLLPAPPDEDILKQFPFTVKRTLVKSVVDELNKKEKSRLMGENVSTIISTPAHAEWILECIGPGFRLPYSEVSILQSLFQLYTCWLFNNWPPGMQPRTQHFFRVIGLHFSLLFEQRKDDSGVITKENDQLEDSRCRFCHQALTDIYLPVVRHFGKDFSKKTWDCYLKILLVITDTILTWKSESKRVINHLATYSIRVLIEVWMLAKTQDEELWTAFRKLATLHEWRDRSHSVIHQFNEINCGFTSCIIPMMYGNEVAEEGALNQITIHFATDISLQNKEIFQMEMSTEEVYFYWYKFLQILGNHARIKSPDIYNLAFLGIERVVDMYLNMSQVEVPMKVPPNTAVLCNIYGNWLFEACDQDKPSFEQGTAVAIRTLCKIFLGPFNYQQISLRHLSSFYHCVAMILLKPEHNIVSHSLLKESRHIFSKNIYGSSILIPHYLYAIGKAWSGGPHKSPSPDVGIACAEIMSSLVCFQNVYWGASFSELSLRSSFSQEYAELITSYIQILPTIQKILTFALTYERDSLTLQLLIWCFSFTLSELFDHSSAQMERLQPQDQKWVEDIFCLLLEKL